MFLYHKINNIYKDLNAKPFDETYMENFITNMESQTIDFHRSLSNEKPTTDTSLQHYTTPPPNHAVSFPALGDWSLDLASMYTTSTPVNLDEQLLLQSSGNWTLAADVSNQTSAATNDTTIASLESSPNNYWALMALGLVFGTAAGNILVCLAICWERRLQNVTNYFLMSLAITDLMVAILVMPLGIVTLVKGLININILISLSICFHLLNIVFRYHLCIYHI